MFLEYFRLTLKNIRHRRMRSWLTILGIIIGVAAVVSLISIGQGLQNAISAQFSQLGTETILVVPKGLQGPPSGSTGITTDDVKTLEKMPYFDFVTPVDLNTGQVEYKRETKFIQVIGFPTSNAEKRFEGQNFAIAEGRYFNSGEKYGAILGYKTAKSGFEKEVLVRSRIKINGVDFTVDGIFNQMGNPSNDNAIYISIDTARTVFNKPNDVSEIILRVKPGTDIAVVSDNIKRELKRARGNENFDVFTPDQILKQASTVLGIVQLILVGIAAISLLVGAIGIMNTMYTSVLERTKEIGIMKAIGATNYDIGFIFLTESGVLGLIGGTIGVIIGSGVAELVGAVAKASGFGLLLIILDPVVIGGALLFAFVIGALSGLMPARHAASLQPVEALRYE
ncbi:MacB-like periplasmic core domain protein [uncultured archaeon]|nr:MacB-like periplasmic core domain protein [uncultured archaeon]